MPEQHGEHRPDEQRNGDQTRIRVLIADDEPPARRRLHRLLAERDDLEVVAEATDGQAAVDAIRDHAPDLVFLDVRMPELDGFDVVAEIGPESMPAAIFTTAFDEHAVRAFEVHALDYLVKPFDDARFETALHRAVEHLRRERLDGLCVQLRALLSSGVPAPADFGKPPAAPAPATPTEPERLVIRSAGRVSFVEPEDVDWIEGAGSYARLHAGARSYLLRDTLSQLEKRLGEPFLRIHRSTVVNLRRVSELRPRSHGESLVVLRDGTELKLSRTYRDRLERLLRG